MSRAYQGHKKMPITSDRHNILYLTYIIIIIILYMSSQVVLVSGGILVTHGRQSLSNLYLILKTWVSYLGLFHCIGLLIHCQWIVWIFYFDYYLYYLYYKYVPKSPHWNKGDLHVLRYHIVTFPPTLYYAGESVPMVQFIALTPVTLFRSARQGAQPENHHRR